MITRGPLLVAGLALLWGSNFAWIKVSLEAFTPAQITFGRMLLGALVLGAVMAVRRDRFPSDVRTWSHLTVAALIANAVPYLLFALAETRVDSGVAGVVNATTPLWTLALVAALGQGMPVGRAQLVGFVLGLAGCVVLFAPWDVGTVDTLGAVYCLLAALSYAASFVYMARYLTPRALTPTVLSAAQLLAATGWTLLPLALGHSAAPSFEVRPVLALVVLGVLGTGAAYVLNYALIRSDGAARASVVIYLLPVVSLALGATLLGESLTVGLVVGTALILLGVVLSRRRSVRERVG